MKLLLKPCISKLWLHEIYKEQGLSHEPYFVLLSVRHLECLWRDKAPNKYGKFLILNASDWSQLVVFRAEV